MHKVTCPMFVRSITLPFHFLLQIFGSLCLSEKKIRQTKPYSSVTVRNYIQRSNLLKYVTKNEKREKEQKRNKTNERKEDSNPLCVQFLIHVHYLLRFFFILHKTKDEILNNVVYATHARNHTNDQINFLSGLD